MAERILISDLFRNTRLALANGIRLLRRKGMDYVTIEVKGGYPERTPRPQRRFPLSLLPWPPPPPSVESFNYALDRVAIDPRVKGVVLLITGLSAGPATVTSLRDAVVRFRRTGKQAIAYLNDVDMWSYYLASACDQVLAPESGSFRAAGLWSEVTFLKDTLAMAGIKADFEAIAEYKTSPDTFRRSKMTDPHREMLESLLDSIYDEVIERVADGRSTTAKHVRKALDSVPFGAEQARDAGLLDDVCYEDELPARLGTHETPAALLAWEQAQRRLIRSRRWRSRRAVGVISLEGMIVPGSSRQPPMPLPIPLPIPSRQAGSDTLIQQIRAAAADRRLAAVIIHVDSPGGSALASDLIWREIAHLRHTKPVVVHMSNVAASGGYYVSAAASAIVAQPLTLTGSIGIFGGKFVTKGLYDKIQAHREVVSRGKAAGLYSDMTAFSDEERDRIRADIGAGYERFKARVAEGRDMTQEQVEAIARGRVWTGKQALEHHLVDELGDLSAATDRACELAQLSPRRYVPLVDVTAGSRQPPQPFPAEAGEWLTGLLRLSRESIFAMAPWEIRIRG
jgi:protease-4